MNVPLCIIALIGVIICLTNLILTLYRWHNEK